MYRIKRRAERIRYPALCQIGHRSYSTPIAVFFRDISLTGIGLESPKPLSLKEIVNLSIFLPVSKKFLALKAQVIRCEKGLATYILGLKFVKTRLREKFLLNRELSWLIRHGEEIVSAYSYILTPEGERIRELAEESITEEEKQLRMVPQYQPRARRVKYPVPVRIGLNSLPFPVSGFLQDISLTGIGLKTTQPIGIEEIVRLSFFLPISRSFTNIEAIVKRCEQVEQGYSLGLEFSKTAEKTKFLIWREIEKVEL